MSYGVHGGVLAARSIDNLSWHCSWVELSCVAINRALATSTKYAGRGVVSQIPGVLVPTGPLSSGGVSFLWRGARDFSLGLYSALAKSSQQPQMYTTFCHFPRSLLQLICTCSGVSTKQGFGCRKTVALGLPANYICCAYDILIISKFASISPLRYLFGLGNMYVIPTHINNANRVD